MYRDLCISYFVEIPGNRTFHLKIILFLRVKSKCQKQNLKVLIFE